VVHSQLKVKRDHETVQGWHTFQHGLKAAPSFQSGNDELLDLLCASHMQNEPFMYILAIGINVQHLPALHALCMDI
jgi:hypothetical protein